MNEFKQKLEETLNRLYKENKLSIDAYSELMEFADPNQALQLQQTGVSGSNWFQKLHLHWRYIYYMICGIIIGYLIHYCH